jgi:hypothetical protein
VLAVRRAAMIVKIKDRVDSSREREWHDFRHTFDGKADLVVLALEFDGAKVWAWLDHAGTLFSIPSYLLDIVDGHLSAFWRVAWKGERLFIGPPELSDPGFEVDLTERDPKSGAAYGELRTVLFAELPCLQTRFASRPGETDTRASRVVLQSRLQ